MPCGRNIHGKRRRNIRHSPIGMNSAIPIEGRPASRQSDLVHSIFPNGAALKLPFDVAKVASAHIGANYQPPLANDRPDQAP
jgi:hypothetical protein